MSDYRKQEHIDDLRKRLYARGPVEGKTERHELTDEKVPVSQNWDVQSKTAETTVQVSIPAVAPEVKTDFDTTIKRSYRGIIILASLFIFIVGVGISAAFLFLGGNQISSDNIGVAVNGPSELSGGDILTLQVGITNQNTIPIESATLIIKYPNGTRAANETERNLYEERIPINSIAPGEVLNVPVRVVVFGEEGEEKQVTATIEYRIEGSNGMFYKDASPLGFRISSTPLVLRIQNLEKVVAGQLVDIKVIAQSNASTPLRNVIIQAQYPNAFDFQKSVPAPAVGESTWKIDEILPEQSYEINIKGVVTGLTEETFRINFEAGPAEAENQFSMASRISEGRADFTIERPFIDVGVAINGSRDKEVVIASNEPTKVVVDITNTLSETVYDLVVEVVPGGNALNNQSIKSDTGFYDSNTGTVRWEVSNNEDFVEVFPGGKRQLAFTIEPNKYLQTASFDLVVNVYARRVAERSAQEQLIGSVIAEAKYSSMIQVANQVAYGSLGPVPPKVGDTTNYIVTVAAVAGANDITDTLITTSLPVYVKWLDEYQGDGTVSYNTVSKQLEWQAGDVDSGQRKELSFLVSIQPSVSQVNEAPVLVNSQQIRANDRFTGALLQSTAGAVTTELQQAGFQKDNGKVRN